MASTGEVRQEWSRVALIALTPVLFVVVATQNGLGITTDSLSYLRPLETGRMEFNPWFPAGLPLLLTVLGSGLGAIAANCLALVANITVSYAMAVTVTGSRAVGLAVAAWLAASVATTQVYAMLWSEPIFVAAINTALLGLVRMVRDRAVSATWLTVLIVATNVAGSMRWAAVFLVPVIGLTLLAVTRGGWLRRLGVSAAATAACLLSVVAGWVNNLAAGESIMGPRVPAAKSVGEVLVEVPRAAGGYVLNGLNGMPTTAPSTGIVAVGVLALVAVGAVVVLWLRTAGAQWNPALPLLGWAVVYLASVLASSASTVIDPLGFRLSAPALSSVVVVTTVAAVAVVPRRWLLAVGAGWLGWLSLTTSIWVLGAAGGRPIAW